jgi:hypothetical protein
MFVCVNFSDSFERYCLSLVEYHETVAFLQGATVEAVKDAMLDRINSLDKRLGSYERKHDTARLATEDPRFTATMEIIRQKEHADCLARVVGIASQLVLIYPIRWNAGTSIFFLFLLAA